MRYTRHGLFRTGTHKSWIAMIRRCHDPKFIDPHYRNLGIIVCAGWQNVKQFYADMGDRPPRHDIDRKDNKGNYTCGKCAQCVEKGWPMNGQWSDRITNSNNRSDNVFLTYNGKTQTIVQWARELSIPPPTLYDRLRNHWTVERALTEPINAKYRNRAIAS